MPFRHPGCTADRTDFPPGALHYIVKVITLSEGALADGIPEHVPGLVMTNRTGKETCWGMKTNAVSENCSCYQNAVQMCYRGPDGVDHPLLTHWSSSVLNDCPEQQLLRFYPHKGDTPTVVITVKSTLKFNLQIFLRKAFI